LTEKAQVLVFPEPRRAVLEEQEVGEPGPGQVLIRSLVTLISTGTDLTAYSGDFPRDRPSSWGRYVKYPFRPGYSSVGEIVAVGPGVEEIAPGQTVFNRSSHASLAIQPAARVVPLPEVVPIDEAAFASISCIAMNGVRMATLALGEAVVIVGMGIVGEMAMQYARLSGAFPLIAVDLSDRRLENALRFGATDTINPSREDLAARVGQITRGRKADAIFEVTGNPGVIPSLPPLIRRGGRLILLGSSRGPTTLDFHDDVHTYGLRLIGAHASNTPTYEIPDNPWTWERNAALFLDLLQARRVAVADLITHRFSWRQAPEAFEQLLSDRTLFRGVILDWEGA
jgi:2-desacetyl-2-hydroxyethyl bacteriochlorophyllide A dehydrogenase